MCLASKRFVWFKRIVAWQRLKKGAHEHPTDENYNNNKIGKMYSKKQNMTFINNM